MEIALDNIRQAEGIQDELLGVKERTVRNRVANLKEEFHLENGVIKRGKALENKASKAKKKQK